jgi:ketosteroid isomerase-like protein
MSSTAVGQDDPLSPLMQAYQAAVLAKDIDGFMALYEREARIFDTWARWIYDDPIAWRAMVTEWFNSLGNDRCEVVLHEWHADTSADMATAHAFITYRGVTAEGRTLRELDNRLTWVARRGDRGWRIVHEHTSAPAGFDDGKLMLRREVPPRVKIDD